MVINIQVDRWLWMITRQQIEVGAVNNEIEGLLGFKIELKDRMVSLRKPCLKRPARSFCLACNSIISVLVGIDNPGFSEV